jgi:hypothetical protein
MVTDEMRRVLEFMDSKAEWWMEQGPRRTNVSAELREGLLAYANKQANVQKRLANSFADKWYPELARNGVVPNWPSHYLQNRTAPVLDPDVEMEDPEDDEIDLDDVFD